MTHFLRKMRKPKQSTSNPPRLYSHLADFLLPRLSLKEPTPDITRQWREQDEKTASEWDKSTTLYSNSFVFIKLLGVGKYGEICLVKNPESRNLYALKCVKLFGQEAEAKMVVNERNVLSEVNSEWILHMYHSAIDEANYNVLLEYVPGGNLDALLRKEGTLSEIQSKFYGAEMLMAINVLHRHGYMHRNIQLDVFLVDVTGHLKLRDFGLAVRFIPLQLCKYLAHDPSFDEDGAPILPRDRRAMVQLYQRRAQGNVGTLDYKAPEVVLTGVVEGATRESRDTSLDRWHIFRNRPSKKLSSCTSYTFACDFWSFGICMYRMLFGHLPFTARNEEDRMAQIVNWRTTLIFPNVKPISDEVKDVLKSLLCNESDRLGANGCEEVMLHVFFEGVHWPSLRQLCVSTPFEFPKRCSTSVDAMPTGGCVEGRRDTDSSFAAVDRSSSIALGSSYSRLHHSSASSSVIADLPALLRVSEMAIPPESNREREESDIYPWMTDARKSKKSTRPPDFTSRHDMKKEHEKMSHHVICSPLSSTSVQQHLKPSSRIIPTMNQE
ncbi:serine/threonine-protein kinase 38-like isoform X2 [Pomacea canaliculata]|uniref:serine/threonine-protein kinase 38-like isoform X2 n=1 Tax=Pomacea canaliculata TaxID=400727 RepID=UPI000D72CB08|nr:serine/threonine-protein kinase 38-like isoform X2 [Pomacea canaliculata]